MELLEVGDLVVVSDEFEAIVVSFNDDDTITVRSEGTGRMYAVQTGDLKSPRRYILTLQDFLSAVRCDGDGSPDPQGAYVLDGGSPFYKGCYANAEPCPRCGDGCIYGTDFPSGGEVGTCLQCGETWVWDAEWVPIWPEPMGG